MSLDVVILAAGKGRRMYSSTPKVLHSLGGRPLLQHVVQTVRQLGADRIVVVYGHGGQQVPSAFADDHLVFVLQEPQLGTGHAVQQALPSVTANRTLVLYGDVPLTRAETLAHALQESGDLSLITADLDDPTGYGRIVRDRAGRVVRIVEERDASPDEKAIREINTGILAAPTAKLRGWLSGLRDDNAQGEYYLTDVIARAVADGTAIHTIQPKDTWEILGVNSKQQLAELERVYQRAQAVKLMEAGVTLADPARIDIRGELTCGQDVSIDVNCVFEGKIVLGAGAKVGANCVIKDTVVEAGARILPFCHVDGARVGAEARVGPYARLRPGTVLAAHAHVGNFVETKNAQLGEGSKANHLAYLGDATIGRNVNIGAGTITCNYDGANKHQTVIEDDAFIGSDSQLVAPVTVGKGATIGAGSTISKDAPAGELTVSRARQTTVQGWKRPAKKKPVTRGS
jgi:bifunctional UDP-N-acetylglucosamine pyrophosphorylase / glucosamine-1-phosphate N-acetyltransferase